MEGSLKKIIRVSFLSILDIAFLSLSLYIAATYTSSHAILSHYYNFYPALIVIKMGLFYLSNMYTALWRYTSIEEFFKIICISIIGNISAFIVFTMIENTLFFKLVLMMFVLDILFIGGTRIVYRMGRKVKNHTLFTSNSNKVLSREVQIEDLLGRESMDVHSQEICEYLARKKVLVTGGGGSIGSELCRQIAALNPRELIVVDINENNAYDLQNELKKKHPNLPLKVIIASVRDKRRIEEILFDHRPQIVFHAAAHKHVHLMEDNPEEAIKNNVFGTLNVAQASNKYGVESFVMISTDKAVNPTNIMGATKRLCEMLIQSMNQVSKTKFAAVRFANILGSNRSVIPLFKKQIAEGGPVQVTHPDSIRYFMTIPEAAQLVMQAGAMAKGGEIFVLDMGEPVKIVDLAKNLIRLSGFVPDKDIKIEIVGLRPGEKLYEELLLDEEDIKSTAHPNILIGQPIDMDYKFVLRRISVLRHAIEDGHSNIKQVMMTIVPTYQPMVYDDIPDMELQGEVAFTRNIDN